METLTIPPSPSWYLSDILCTGPNGQVIYGTRYDLIILDFDFNTPGNINSPKFQTLDYAHKERITAVRFCPNVDSIFGNYFVSGGDDSLVKLWDLKTLTPTNVNFAHGDDKKIISVDWSPVAHNEIVSADEAGGIVVWDIGKNTTNKLNVSNLLKVKKSMGVKVNVGKFSPSTIKCCPHERDLLAVGMKGGIVCLLSTKDSGKVLHCLRGHDKDVSSLAWCPDLGNIFDEKGGHDKTLIFASVCRDRVIYFWNALNGRFIKIIKLPTSYMGRNARLPSASPPLLSWPNKYTILSCSSFGELLKCNLYDQRAFPCETAEVDVENNSPKKTKGFWSLVHDVHPRGVFSIHTAQYASEGKDTKNTVVWTTAQDRNLIAFRLEDEKVLVNIPTIGGFVYSIVPSPLDPSRVAVGLGDFSIRIWNTGNAKAIQMTSLWHKIKGKVMVVAWHPTQEMKLAYGTHEGRVGIQDLVPGHLPKVFILRHRNPVYALSWGPPCFKEGEVHKYPKFCLYSCGEGVILMYDPDEPEKEPVRINTLMNGRHEESNTKKKGSGCTDIAWKPDYSLFAVGNSEGTLQLYSAPHLELVQTIHAHQKLLMCLAWHPMSTSSDVGLSPLQHCLATGSNDRTIHVFDLSSLTKSVASKEEFKGSIQPMTSFKGHQDKVVRLAWSPHASGQLCSASYDSTVRVWDIIHQNCYGCFMGQKGACLSCMWSSLDPDIIISGSSNFTLIAWRITEAKYNPKSSSVKRPKKSGARPFAPVDNTEKRNDVPPGAEGGNLKPASQPGKPTLFPVSWKVGGGIGNVDGIHQLIKREETGHLEDTNDRQTAKVGFFGTKEDMGKLLQKEEDHHLNYGCLEQARLIGLWKGNVAEMVKDAIAKGNLSEWLVSIAPSASHKLWLEACQAYSEQLANNGKYDRAAAYLLACHKVDEAVELLRGHSLFREALAIARCRLDEEDPTIRKLLMEWGQDLLMKGNYEVAAMCFTSTKEYLDAARALRNRTNMPECISLAAKLALKAGEEGKELAMLITLQCLRSYLCENNWNGALECIKPIKELKPLSIVIELQRKLVEGNQSIQGKNEDLLSHWLSGNGKNFIDGETALLQLSSLPWTNDSSISATDAYSLISNRRSTSEKNLMIGLASELALAVCAASSGDRVKEWYHILKSMNICYAQQLLISKEQDVKFSLLHLCFLLSPSGPEGFNIAVEDDECEIVKGHLQSVRAYSALAAAMWSESKWLESDGECPWHLLASFLLSHLPDALDSHAASYYKDEVEIHKIEKELAILKVSLKLSNFQVKDSKKECKDSGDKSQEKSSANEDMNHSELTREGEDGKECEAKRSDEEIIKVLESTLVDLKRKREDFEKTRATAPNPFLLLFKLRNIADFMAKSCKDEESGIKEVFHEFQDRVLKVDLTS